nr:hypothetical protein [Dawidia cretensis]
MVIDLFCIASIFNRSGESPAYDVSLGLQRSDKSATGIIALVGVAIGCQPHVPTFLSGPTHTVNDVQGAPIIFYLWSCQVESKHHFVFGYGQIQWLLDGLRFHSKFAEHVYHLVGVASVAAETVPFEKHDGVCLIFILA